MTTMVGALTGACLTVLLVTTTALAAPGHTVMKETVTGEAAMKMAMDGASMVKKTVPSDGASMGRSPKEIRIAFAHPARLAVLRLTTIAGEVIPVEFRQSEETSAEIVVALPELDPEDYTVHWRARGDDGHVMSGSFSFSISRQ